MVDLSIDLDWFFDIIDLLLFYDHLLFYIVFEYLSWFPFTYPQKVVVEHLLN